MERLLFVGNVALATAPTTLVDVDAKGIEEGAIALYDHEGKIISTALTKRIPMFTLFVGGGAFTNNSKYFNIVSDIDTRHFSYVKSSYVNGTKFSAKITVPTSVVVGKDYTLTMAKAHTVLNERYKWSASERAREGDTAAIIAKKLSTQLNSLGKNGGFTASVSNAEITVTGTDYEAWNLIAGDSLFGVNITGKAMKPINDDAALKELQIRCIGAEGINSTSNDARKLYTLPKFSNTEGWTVFTLTFYPHRDLRSGSTENVKTIIHLAIPTKADRIDDLEKIFASVNTPVAETTAAGA